MPWVQSQFRPALGRATRGLCNRWHEIEYWWPGYYTPGKWVPVYHKDTSYEERQCSYTGNTWDTWTWYPDDTYFPDGYGIYARTANSQTNNAWDNWAHVTVYS